LFNINIIIAIIINILCACVLQSIRSRELAPRIWLGRDIYVHTVNVTVTSAAGATASYDAVNIRQVDAKTGRFTKKGIFLRPNRWAGLKLRAAEIQSHLCGKEHRRFNVGGGIMAGSGGEYKTVSIRHFWRPEGMFDALATRKGIDLTPGEWGRLCDNIAAIEAPSAALREAIACELSHEGQHAAAQCTECHPFDI